jgi:hypothetical protein
MATCRRGGVQRSRGNGRNEVDRAPAGVLQYSSLTLIQHALRNGSITEVPAVNENGGVS